MKILTKCICADVCLFLFVTLPALQLAKSSNTGDGISYEISAQQSSGKDGYYVTLKLMVANHGSEAIYISRDIGRCSKWSGHSEIQLVNERGENQLVGGCDIAEAPIRDSELKEVLRNSDLWIRLLPNEIYGEEETISIPSKHGRYQLKAELWPPGFPEQQKKLLKEQGLRVLEYTHKAAPIEINID